MALIKCPECNGQISDATKQCVHCGFRFNICPECGKVIDANLMQCNYCGYEIKKEDESDSLSPENENEKTQPEVANGDYLSLWEKDSPSGRIFKMCQKPVGRILASIEWVLLLVLMVNIITFLSSNALDQLVNAASYLSNIKALLLWIAFFAGLGYIYSTAIPIIKSIMLSNWLTVRKLDPIKGISYYYSMITDNGYENGDLLVSAGYLKSVVTAKSKVIGILIALSVLYWGFCFSTAAFIYQNYEFFELQTRLLEQPFEFQYVALIIAGVFWAAYAVVYFAVFRSYYKICETQWLERVAPGLKESRSKKIEEMINKI